MTDSLPSRTTRLDALDLIRGWCLIVIACDHLLRFPSVFDVLTGRGMLWVTAAEGFFFISGMLVSIARGRLMREAGFMGAARKLWSRAAKLYLASVILSAIYIALGYWLTAHHIDGVKGGLVYFANTGELVRQVLLFKYNYGWADFLYYYAVFLFIAPVALWLLRKGWWWAVVIPTLLVWLFKNGHGLPFNVYYGIWQTYFFLGMVVGYHFHAIAAAARKIPRPTYRWLWQSIIAATVITVIASFIFTFATPFFDHFGPQANGWLKAVGLPGSPVLYTFFHDLKENSTFKALFQDNRAGLLRLPLFLLWFTALFLLVRRYEGTLLRRIGWLLVPLGRNSLYVYIVQSIVVFAVPFLHIPFNYLTNTLVDVAVILLCWWAVKRRLLFRIIPR